MLRLVCLLLFAALLALMPTPSHAESDPTDIVEIFFASLKSGSVAPGFAKLMSHSRVDEAKPMEIQLVRGQIEQAFQLYGQPLGFERIKQVRSGTSIERLVFITKHSYVPLVWNFYFYKSASDWELVNVLFNDQMANLE